MPVGDFFRKLEDRLRNLVETPLEPEAAPIILRDRVAEAVEDHVVPAVGAGEVVKGRIEILLRAPSAERRALLEKALVVNGALADAVRRQLARAGVQPSAGLDIAVEVVEDAGAPCDVTWIPEAEEQPLDGDRYGLTVLEGTAEEPTYAFGAGTAVFVGRQREVYDPAGRIVRRNDVAFEGSDDGPNATVSRAHAVIRRGPDGGALRIYDDDSTRGTAIFREGAAGLIPVRRRGLPLRHGDLIYFGDARVRFEWVADDESPS